MKRRADDRRFPARVVAVGRDCDLALLAVEDDTFWENATFASFAELPAIRDRMTVVGFPIGGEQVGGGRAASNRFPSPVVSGSCASPLLHLSCSQVSVTQGIVSRVEVTGYSLAWRRLLALQIDACECGGRGSGPC